jgi:hypothetical protein
LHATGRLYKIHATAGYTCMISMANEFSSASAIRWYGYGTIVISLLNINFTYLGTFNTEIPTEKVDRPNEEGRAHPPAGRESRCQTQTSSRNPDSSRRWAGSRPGTADSKQKNVFK